MKSLKNCLALLFLVFGSISLTAQCVVTNLDGGVIPGSLRQAVITLNNGGCGANTVTFDPNLNGTINLQDEVHITRNGGRLDGLGATNVSIAGPSNNHAIRIQPINPSTNPNRTDGIVDVVVKDLNISSAGHSGILLVDGARITIENNVISGIGTAQDVSAASWVGAQKNVVNMQYAGISTRDINNLTIENNLVVNNNGHGIRIESARHDLTGDNLSAIVRRNKSGVLSDGRTPAGNLGDGILIKGSRYVLVERNQSSANGNRSLWPANPTGTAVDGLRTDNWYGAGIELSGSSFCTVIGNTIGTNGAGSNTGPSNDNSLGNHKHGIYLRSDGSPVSGNKIGLPSQGNVIGGNGFAFDDVLTNEPPNRAKGHGIQLHNQNGRVSSNEVFSNLVGLNRDNCIPNNQDAISLLGFSGNDNQGFGVDSNEIGGIGPGEGNVIGGSVFGIFSQGSNAVNNNIRGNFIGVNAAGIDLGCPVQEDGIVIQGASSDNTISQNTISNVPKTAVKITGVGSNGNTILDNSMTCNGRGIVLVEGGFINGTFFLGGNDDFGRALINVAFSDASTIQGFSPAAGDFVDIYRADDCAGSGAPCQASNGANAATAQGAEYITTIVAVAKDASIFPNNVIPEQGSFTYDLSSAPAGSGLTYQNILLTARDANNGNTSQFHTCVSVGCRPPESIAFDSPTVFNLCGTETATVRARINQRLDDNSDISAFRFNLYRLPNLTTPTATNATGVFTINTPGTYRIEGFNPSSEVSCALLSTTEITVARQAPVTGLSINVPTGVCQSDQNVPFSVTTTPNRPNSSFSWSISNDAGFAASGSNITVPVVNSNFTISVIETTAAPFNCVQSTVSTPITVSPLPVAVPIVPIAAVCEGDVVTYSVNGDASSTYQWAVSAVGATAPNSTTNEFVVTWGPNSGTVQVTEVSNNNCSRATPTTQAITVTRLPTTQVIRPGDAVCAGSTVNLSVPNRADNTYQWTVAGNPVASVTNQVSFTAPEANSVEVTVVQTNPQGCVSAAPSSITLDVNARPLTTAIDIADTDVCLGENYTVSVDPTPGVEYIWSANPASMIPPGSNSVANSLNLVGSVSGTITVIARNLATGCETSATESESTPVDVRAIPVEPILFGEDSIVCSAVEDYRITNYSDGLFQWFYSNGAVGVNQPEGVTTTIRSVTVDFPPQRAVVSVKAISPFGCESTLGSIEPVPVGCQPRADFSVDSAYCLNEIVTLIETATYTDTTLEPLVMRYELVGAGQTTIFFGSMEDVDVNYLAPGRYKIEMFLEQAGFFDSTSRFVVIKELPTIETSSISGLDQVCQNTNTIYTVIPDNPESIYTWSFPGAVELVSTRISEDLRFGPTDQDVEITVIEDRFGCIDSAKKVIDVISSPTVKAFGGDSEICVNDTLKLPLIDASTNSTYDWSPLTNVVTFNADSTEAWFVFDTAGDEDISVIETNQNGCFSADSTSRVTIVVKPLPDNPEIDGSGLAGICDDGTTASFFTSSDANKSYQWTSSTGDLINDPTSDSILVTPTGTGVRNISLVISVLGCRSDQVDTTFFVEPLQPGPSLDIVGGSFCEESDTLFKILNPTVGSIYSWTSPDSSTIIGPTDRDSIRIKFGPNDGTITVQEITSIGCPSGITSVPVNIQRLVREFTLTGRDSICSTEAIDNQLQYNVSVPHAENVNYQIFLGGLPITTSISPVDDGQGNLQISFPEIFEDQTLIIQATATSFGGCNSELARTQVFVKESVPTEVSIVGDDICEGDSIFYSSQLSVEDPTGTFRWFMGNTLISTNDAIRVPGKLNGDSIRVVYTPTLSLCAENDESTLQAFKVVKAWVRPEMIGTINGSGVHIVPNKEDVQLEGELTIVQEPGATYFYQFYYLDDSDTLTDGIVQSTGTLPGSGQVVSIASIEDLPTGIKERRYYIETFINDSICREETSMLVKIEFEIVVPDVLCTVGDPECPILTIPNLEEFPESSIIIFNRWGSIVFEAENGSFVSWDGTNNGRKLPAGTYFYKLDLGDQNNTVQSGPITLLK